MEELQAQIKNLNQSFHESLQRSNTIPELEQLRVDFLGRSGHLTQLMAQIKTLSLEEKKEYGPRLNALKNDWTAAIHARHEQLEQEAYQATLKKEQSFDVTAYSSPDLQGSLHVYTTIIQELEDIFISMGFEVVDGLEVETDYYNFQALNIPENHPARELHDTFWLNIPHMLLRTHTSSVQAHVMESKQPPLAIFAPGRCYRNEATDATHDFMFTQGECLVVDKNISISSLLDTAQSFLQSLFNKKDLSIRVRPGYFPFVEPGLEIDASCPFCTSGCSICKKTGWVELLGAGLIHPEVLRINGLDPEIYSGFAFGFGIERLAMLRYGITDIRLLRSGKMSFLKQF